MRPAQAHSEDALYTRHESPRTWALDETCRSDCLG